MGDFMKDLATSGIMAGNVDTAKVKNRAAQSKVQLDMTDFLQLMITELTSQSIDSTADTSDMLNQMVQMQMIQALTNMTDASIMGYAASLVGKEVTVGQIGADGKIEEICGQVTGTGTMNGQQVVFVKDKYYFMNEIMAVGKLPEIEDPDKTEGDKTEGTDTPKDPDKTEGTDTPKDPDKTEGTGGTESGGSENGEDTADPEDPGL